MDLAVRLEYLRSSSSITPNPVRYALKADSVTINLQKTPIQIPIPQNTPQLVDFGIFRPSITVSAIVDNVGGDNMVTTAGYEGMERIYVTQGTSNSLSTSVIYYVPYKNALEQELYQWIADDENTLWLYLGDHTYPVYNRQFGDGTTDSTYGILDLSSGSTWATGGAVYSVALQQARFQLDAGREDRWICQMQFVSKARRDVSVNTFGAS